MNLMMFQKRFVYVPGSGSLPPTFGTFVCDLPDGPSALLTHLSFIMTLVGQNIPLCPLIWLGDCFVKWITP
ncbi:hypothetical protein TNCT_630551 [Trichonephila clavata]|uniref:Uncharacterized protein n=1 Tax=Trichonephila clavata TaxID=2740835 RepID=A0A8X6HVP3_TRICU|nr:hypothetical protein TNCT_630551 [Trichonephila clavata]